MQKKIGWDMRVVLYRMFGLFFGFFILIGQCESRGTLPPLYDFQKKVEQARSSFEDVYYELVKSHFFDDVNNPSSPYSNNLIISTNLNDDPVMQGTILLSLISWLEKKNDRDSRFLLRKINRLYHLEFHTTLSSLNTKDENYKDSLLGSFHELSKYKIFNVAIGTDYPFGNAITKAVLTLFVVNKTSVPYAQKKESVLYTLEKIKQEMLRINNGLGKEKIDEEFIRVFIFGLEKFGVRETLVESKIFRNLIITTIVIAIIGFSLYRWDLVSKGADQAGVWANDFFTKAIDGLTEKIAEGFEKVWHINARADRMEAQVNTATNDLRTAINDLRTNGPMYADQATERAVRGALRAAAHNAPQPLPVVPGAEPNLNPDAPVIVPEGPNPDVQIIVAQALTPAIARLDQLINEARAGYVGRTIFGNAPQPPVPVVAVPGDQQQPPQPPAGGRRWFGGLFGGGEPDADDSDFDDE
ncbi:hypothetical protein JST56_05470 [Candidatus Dependentiae bacterium]|nr:hypothetical protein [Candidatus Dependentiae bacterium]